MADALLRTATKINNNKYRHTKSFISFLDKRIQFKIHSYAKTPRKPFPINKKQAIDNPWQKVEKK